MFTKYLYSQKAIRKQQQKIQVLLAISKHDSDMILSKNSTQTALVFPFAYWLSLPDCPRLNEVTEEDINSFYSHKSVPVMLAAKEQHKKFMRKYRSKWHELIVSDSDSDYEDSTAITRNEKEKLKSTMTNKKPNKITWLDDDVEFDSRLKLMDHHDYDSK
jgi:long-subunit acyl-CoA synthetase (AMP-forming)